jgi:hypothetical protein
MNFHLVSAIGRIQNALSGCGKLQEVYSGSVANTVGEDRLHKLPSK